MKLPTLLIALCLAACASTPPPADDPQSTFHANLRGLCGNAYAGRMVTSDPQDVAFAGQPLRLEVRCTPAEVRMGVAVGEDRSRTWVVTRPAGGLRLKHDHRHADGTADVLTNYGGDARGRGTAGRQSFPADAESIALFRTRGNPASAGNVWTLELTPGASLFYDLQRPNRHFRLEFDVSFAEPLA